MKDSKLKLRIFLIVLCRSIYTLITCDCVFVPPVTVPTWFLLYLLLTRSLERFRRSELRCCRRSTLCFQPVRRGNQSFSRINSQGLSQSSWSIDLFEHWKIKYSFSFGRASFLPSKIHPSHTMYSEGHNIRCTSVSFSVILTIPNRVSVS